MQQTNLSTSSSSTTSSRKFITWKRTDRSQKKVGDLARETTAAQAFARFCGGVLLPLVLLLVVMGYVFTSFFENKIILGSETCGAYKVNRIIHQSNKNEIPIFGASRALTSFIPDSIDANIFNYGTDGTGANVLLMMLDEECKRQNKKSPLIIINLDLEGLRSSIGDICNYLYNADYKPVKDLLGAEFKQHYNIPVIKYYAQFELYTKYYLNDRMQLTKYTNKGASIEKNELTQKKFEELVNQRRSYSTRFLIDKGLSEHLQSLVRENKDRYFLFVVSPYHQSYFEKFANLSVAKKYLSDLDALDNVKVLDYSPVVYPNKYFINTTHLNYTGALAFTKTFKDSLNEVLPVITSKGKL